MKRNIIVILGIMSLLGLLSCKGQEKMVVTEVPIELTESQKREYNYALTEATKQKLFGNYQQAERLYQKCIEVNPGSDAAHFQLSGILMMNQDIEGAKAMNNRAVQLNPENYWYRIQLAQLYLISENIDSALLVYEGVVKKWPNKPEIKYELARLNYEKGENSKALKMLNEIERENGLSEPVSMLKEQIYIGEKKPDLAEIEILALLEVFPDEIRYLGVLAELYTSEGKTEKAIQTYNRIFEIEPDNGIAQLSMSEFYRNNQDAVNRFIYLEKAMVNNSLGLDRKIMVLIDLLTQEDVFTQHKMEILMLIGILEEQYPGDYKVLTAKADYLSKDEKYKEALEVYDEVLKEQKGNYYIWEQTVFIENMMESPQAVYDRCNEALSFFEDRPLLYLFKGNAATELGKSKESIQVLEKGLEYVQNNIPLTVQFYSFLAEAWRAQERFSESDEYFEQAILMDPENLMILNNYSYYLSLREVRLDDAEEMSKKTILADPENSTYLDTYAWILFKSGQNEKAKKYLEKALKFGGSEDPDILEHYGDIIYEMGLKEEARKFWEKAKSYGGKNETLKIKLGE